MTTDEKQCIDWAKTYYSHWRKRWGKTRGQHKTERPRHISDPIWDSWYDSPFGDQELNRKIKVIRKYLGVQ